MNSDPISNPLGLIDEMYRSSCNSSITSSNDFSFGEYQYYENLLQNNNEFYSNVPVLTKASLGRLQQNTLVKYRGLVQDIFDIEYFCTLFEERSLKTNETRMVLSKYRDIIPNTSSTGKLEGSVDFDLEGPNSKTVERLSILLVPIPGESDWSMQYFESLQKDNQHKEQLQQQGQINKDRKRSPDNDSSDSIDNDFKQRKKLLTSSSNIDDNNNNASGNDSNKNSNSSQIEVDAANISCLAKFYDNDAIEKGFRLNDMIEVIGIFSLETYADSTPYCSDQSNDYDQLYFGDAGEPFANNLPPSSIAPRVHCITYRRLGSSFPLLIEVPTSDQDYSIRTHAITKFDSPFAMGNAKINLTLDKVSSARDKVITMIQNVFAGDRLVATYVMLAMLSRVYGRHDNLVLGSLALNIIGLECQDPRINLLKDAISLIVPRCTLIRADIESFNSNVFLPFKDYDKNIMQRSPLQLAAGTITIIDETNMKEGVLNKQGIDSVKALQSVVSKQILPVVFANYEVKLPTDYSLIFLSNLSPSLITSVSSDVIKIKMVQLKGDDESMDIEAISDIDAIDDIRKWWSNCRLGDVKMDETMIKYAEDDFVKARQSKDIPPSTFHTWLTIARLITISFGLENMDPQHWDIMREMESQRMNTFEIE